MIGSGHGEKGPEVMEKEILVTFKEILLHVQIRNGDSGLRTRLKSCLYRRCCVVFKNSDSEEGKPRSKPGGRDHPDDTTAGRPEGWTQAIGSSSPSPLPLEYLFSPLVP